MALNTGITSTVMKAGASAPSVGSVAKASAQLGIQSLNFAWTAPAGNQDCILGDPKNICATVLGGTRVQANTTDIGDVSVANSVFDIAPVAVRTMNITVSDVSQFANKFFIATCDVNGASRVVPIDPALYQRNNQFNPLLMTLDFGDSPIVLNWGRAITFVQLLGVSVSINLGFSYVAGRG